MDDQCEAAGRTDVLTFTSDVLTAPKIGGQPIANLVALPFATTSHSQHGPHYRIDATSVVFSQHNLEQTLRRQVV